MSNIHRKTAAEWLSLHATCADSWLPPTWKWCGRDFRLNPLSSVLRYLPNSGICAYYCLPPKGTAKQGAYDKHHGLTCSSDIAQCSAEL